MKFFNKNDSFKQSAIDKEVSINYDRVKGALAIVNFYFFFLNLKLKKVKSLRKNIKIKIYRSFKNIKSRNGENLKEPICV